MTGQQVADIFERGKDWLSKIERGHNAIELYDYLTVALFLREELGETHPAVLLAEHLMSRRPRKAT